MNIHPLPAGGVWRCISGEWIRFHAMGFVQSWGMIPGLLLYWVCVGAVLAVLWFSGRKRGVLIRGCAVFWMVLMSVWIYPMLMHRAYLPFLILVFLVCLLLQRAKGGRTGKRIQGIALGLLALITFPDTFRMAKMDVLYPFSNREQMAYYIRTHVPAESRIITFPADLISSTLTAYLPEHRFYNCRTNKRYRFYTRKEGIPAAFSNALLHHYAPGRGKRNIICCSAAA